MVIEPQLILPKLCSATLWTGSCHLRKKLTFFFFTFLIENNYINLWNTVKLKFSTHIPSGFFLIIEKSLLFQFQEFQIVCTECKSVRRSDQNPVHTILFPVIFNKMEDNHTTFDRWWKAKGLLPHYLYCNIVYSTINCQQHIKIYRDTRKSTWQTKRFKSTLKMITFIFLIGLKL